MDIPAGFGNEGSSDFVVIVAIFPAFLVYDELVRFLMFGSQAAREI